MKINLKPAYRYQFGSMLKSSAIVYLLMIIIMSTCMICAANISVGSSSTVSFTGYCITAAILLFVMGIVNIRSDLRLLIQYGISRRTSFISELIAVLSISAVLAAAGEILMAMAQLYTTSNSRFIVADLYQLIYLGGDKEVCIPALTLSQHVLSAVFNLSITTAAYVFGMFFSLMFWRLNKAWTIIAAVSIPIVINVVPSVLVKAGVDFRPFANWLLSSPFCFILFFLLLAAFFAIIDWLLLRRANIREAK